MLEVRIWRGDSPVHCLSAMVHIPECSFARRYSHLPRWRRFTSFETVVEELGGDLIFACVGCVEGDYPRIDRNHLRRNCTIPNHTWQTG